MTNSSTWVSIDRRTCVASWPGWEVWIYVNHCTMRYRATQSEWLEGVYEF